MTFPDRETVKRLREQFPKGCRIVLDSMNDPYVTIPPGTQGVCHGVDDAGSVMAAWDCGSSLSVAYGADRAHRVASDTEIKVSLDWIGKRQREATSAPSEGFHCPRCGKRLDSFERHALSRYADITVCDSCGTVEALEKAGLIPTKALSDWWCVEYNWKI